jgi:hypothetical protein
MLCSVTLYPGMVVVGVLFSMTCTTGNVSTTYLLHCILLVFALFACQRSNRWQKLALALVAAAVPMCIGGYV